MSFHLTDDMSKLVHVTSHYLSQCLPRSVLPCVITVPHWVKLVRHIFSQAYLFSSDYTSPLLPKWHHKNSRCHFFYLKKTKKKKPTVRNLMATSSLQNKATWPDICQGKLLLDQQNDQSWWTECPAAFIQTFSDWSVCTTVWFGLQRYFIWADTFSINCSTKCLANHSHYLKTAIWVLNGSVL